MLFIIETVTRNVPGETEDLLNPSRAPKRGLVAAASLYSMMSRTSPKLVRLFIGDARHLTTSHK
eukprot:1919889-Amphidinium_carterae.1